MGIYAVSAQEFTRFTRNLPRAEEIATLFRTAAPGGRWGEWIGPAPRVTREKFLTQGYRTRVTWLVRFPDDDWNRQHGPYVLQNVIDNVNARLRTQSTDWETAHAQPYAASLNGPISWWESGLAARTRTSVVDPAMWERFTMPVENPIGPDTREQSRLQEAGTATLSDPAWATARWALVVGASGVALYGAFWAITRWGSGGTAMSIGRGARAAMEPPEEIVEPEVVAPPARSVARRSPATEDRGVTLHPASRSRVAMRMR